MAQKAFTPGLAPDIISCFGFVLLLQAEVSVSMIRKPSMLRACAEFSQPLTCVVYNTTVHEMDGGSDGARERRQA